MFEIQMFEPYLRCEALQGFAVCVYIRYTYERRYIYIYTLRLRLKKSMCQAKVCLCTLCLSSSGMQNMQNGLHRRTDSAKLPGVKLFEPVPLPCEPVPCEPVPCEPMPCEPVPCEPVPCEPVPCEPVPCGVFAFLSRSPNRTSKVGCLCPKSQYTNLKEKRKIKHMDSVHFVPSSQSLSPSLQFGRPPSS